jgi:hypothetical protein
MQNSISPAAIRGRNRCFCSSVPNRISVGPTVLTVSIGTGAEARIDSSKKRKWSTSSRPCPPYSFGQPKQSQPSFAIWRRTALVVGPMPCSVASFSRMSGVRISS